MFEQPRLGQKRQWERRPGNEYLCERGSRSPLTDQDIDFVIVPPLFFFFVSSYVSHISFVETGRRNCQGLAANICVSPTMKRAPLSRRVLFACKESAPSLTPAPEPPAQPYVKLFRRYILFIELKSENYLIFSFMRHCRDKCNLKPASEIYTLVYALSNDSPVAGSGGPQLFSLTRAKIQCK